MCRRLRRKPEFAEIHHLRDQRFLGVNLTIPAAGEAGFTGQLREAHRPHSLAESRALTGSSAQRSGSPDQAVCRLSGCATWRTFIQGHIEDILTEWDTFARSIQPEAQQLSAERLRDHAREMLDAIILDMAGEQTAAEQRANPKDTALATSLRAKPLPRRCSTPFIVCAEGFTLNEVVAEYRALRASVVRLWTREMGQADRSSLDELTRFSEAID